MCGSPTLSRLSSTEVKANLFPLEESDLFLAPLARLLLFA